MATAYQNPQEAQTALTSAFTPTGGSLTPQQQAAINTASALVPTISASGLQQQQKAATIPDPTKPAAYPSLASTGNAVLDSNAKSFQDMLAALPKPPSAADQYNTDYNNSGYAQLQQQQNADAAATLAAKNDLSGVNAKLLDVQAQGEAAKQQNVISGVGGATRGFVDAQAAQVDRQTAVQAIPLQVQAFIAQSKVAAAQGQEQLSQQILTQAQQHLDALYQIHQTDATNQYNYQKDLVKSVYDFATTQQKALLDAQTKINDQKFTTQQNNLNYAQSISQTAIDNGRADIAAKISALDPTSPTYQQDVARLAGTIPPKPTASNDGFSSSNINTTVNQIAGSFDSEPIVKNFNVINEGYQFAKNLSNTSQNPADDQGLIYAFAKIMDPNSVVREGEYNTVQKYSQSWVSAYGKSITQAINGTGFLSTDARANIKKTLEQRYQASKTNYDNVYKQYQGRIKKAEAGGGNSITDYSQAYNVSPSSTNPLGI